MALTLALVSGSVLAGPMQWNSVDNLVNTSTSINTTLNAAMKRVSGAQGGVGVSAGNVTPNGYLETSATLLSNEQVGNYNIAILDVQADIFSKTAQEYFAEEYEAAGISFGAAVDAFVDATTQIAIASHVMNMATEVQASGDAIKGQQLQAYVLDGNVLISSAEQDAFNNSQTALQDAADQYAAVAAVYNDATMIQSFQTNADLNGVDFLNADSVFLDRIENQGITGFNAGVVVDFTSTAALYLVEDISANIQTTEFFNQAGTNDFFYITGATQDPNTLCSVVNGVKTGTWQADDPTMPCYLEPTP
jgi:hypothetical protein